MSRQDPGAANGLPTAVLDPPCICTHQAALHGFGRRGGQTVRTACSASSCPCARYEAQRTPQPDRCPTCGAHWDAIETARRSS